MKGALVIWHASYSYLSYLTKELLHERALFLDFFFLFLVWPTDRARHATSNIQFTISESRLIERTKGNKSETKLGQNFVNPKKEFVLTFSSRDYSILSYSVSFYFVSTYIFSLFLFISPSISLTLLCPITCLYIFLYISLTLLCSITCVYIFL